MNHIQNQKQTGGYPLVQSKSQSRSRSRSRTKGTDKDRSNSKDRGQSQNQSQSQSQNGGRRRKSTMRKLRRMKKSRKVMRGGGAMYNNVEDLKKLFAIKDELKQQLFDAYKVTNFTEMMNLNNSSFNTNMIASELGSKGYNQDSELVKLLRSATQ